MFIELFYIYNFSLYIEMVTKYYQKYKEKKHVKDIKSFWRRKSKKEKKGPRKILNFYYRGKRRKASALSET